MTVFFTSDTHFGHKNIIHLGEGRPFFWIDQMNDEIVRRWNEKVKADDTVYHMGDVALGPFAESIAHVGRLNGTIHLVPGNHDRISSVEKPGRRERFMPMYQAVFDHIEDEVIELVMPGVGFVSASHYPYDGDSHDKERYRDLRPKDRGAILLHGHTHSKEKVSRSKKGSMQIHVGMDSWGYAPVSEHEIQSLIRLTNGI